MCWLLIKKSSCHKFKEVYDSYEDFTLLKYQLSQNKMYNQTAIHCNYRTPSHESSVRVDELACSSYMYQWKKGAWGQQ